MLLLLHKALKGSRNIQGFDLYEQSCLSLRSKFSVVYILMNHTM